MASRLSRRTVRRLKRGLMPFAALFLLFLLVLIAFRFAPHPDNTPRMTVPSAGTPD